MPRVVFWNPRLRISNLPVVYRIPRLRRVNNFGDLLGPLIVSRICELQKLNHSDSDKRRLLTVGSIINVEARAGDVVWGSGIHGNLLPLRNPIPHLDIRALRGPLTARVLQQSGLGVPEIYGDPALLIPKLWSDSELGIHRQSGGTLHVPNYEDIASAPNGALDPRGNPFDIVRKIASAKLVIANSLHAIIIAESYGVPTIVVASPSQRLFKYEDYFEGTGRSLPRVASDWNSASRSTPSPPIKNWDHASLLRAFPADLW
jgi:pyruvyltransferase